MTWQRAGVISSIIKFVSGHVQFDIEFRLFIGLCPYETGIVTKEIQNYITYEIFKKSYTIADEKIVVYWRWLDSLFELLVL